MRHSAVWYFSAQKSLIIIFLDQNALIYGSPGGTFLLITYYLSLITYYLSLITYYLLLTTYHLLLTTYILIISYINPYNGGKLYCTFPVIAVVVVVEVVVVVVVVVEVAVVAVVVVEQSHQS